MNNFKSSFFVSFCLISMAYCMSIKPYNTEYSLDDNRGEHFLLDYKSNGVNPNEAELKNRPPYMLTPPQLLFKYPTQAEKDGQQQIFNLHYHKNSVPTTTKKIETNSSPNLKALVLSVPNSLQIFKLPTKINLNNGLVQQADVVLLPASQKQETKNNGPDLQYNMVHLKVENIPVFNCN